MRINIQYHKTPYGELILGSFKDQLCLCDWRYRKMRDRIDQRITKGLNTSFAEQDDDILRAAREQLDQYFNHGRKAFDLPILMTGTEFQKQVWNELLNVPYGQTVTYLQLSRNLGNEQAIRAVAAANGANAISIMIPCHRIIGSDGKLIGYAGGLKAKQKLLELENNLFSQVHP
ncbi:MAG: methylated-DNA--[protein]-cysteine S-methyltransferase [Desulfobacteraceae bacterium]|nr:MAG: methylated-DNA--[protein]-cysteine S-methyltransferase [Desulfobacteraceae bacterium]